MLALIQLLIQSTGKLLPQIEAVCPRTAPAGTLPFVMWMSQRTGSSWATQLINSHPDIEMRGEDFNDCTDVACFKRMCDFLTSTHRRTVVRGFKQKFLYCGAPLKAAQHDLETHDVWHSAWLQQKLCEAPDGEHDALERCLVPLEGISDDVAKSTSAIAHEVYMNLGTKIICSLRRNAFDLALSVASHRLLIQSCGASNLANSDVAACWSRVTQAGVHVDSRPFVDEVRRQVRFTRFQRQICEAQAKKTPVFFLWYEDMVDDFEKTMRDVQIFLGVSPRQLVSNLRPTNADASSWIINYAELAMAAAQAVTMLQRSNEDCYTPLGNRGIVRKNSSTAGSGIESGMENLTFSLVLKAIVAPSSPPAPPPPLDPPRPRRPMPVPPSRCTPPSKPLPLSLPKPIQEMSIPSVGECRELGCRMDSPQRPGIDWGMAWIMVIIGWVFGVGTVLGCAHSNVPHCAARTFSCGSVIPEAEEAELTAPCRHPLPTLDSAARAGALKSYRKAKRKQGRSRPLDEANGLD